MFLGLSLITQESTLIGVCKIVFGIPNSIPSGFSPLLPLFVIDISVLIPFIITSNEFEL